MKVRATRICFDGFKRRYPSGHNHRDAGQAFEISNDRYKQGDKIPDNRKIGDAKAFSPIYMEIVDDKSAPAQKKESPIESRKTSDQDVI